MASSVDDKSHAAGAATIAAPGTPREGVFDHAVLNLHYDLDAGEALFRALGFTLSPRSHHTLGSMNNLVMFGTNYLELIGLDAGNPNPRKELLDWPVGLNGLVYGSDDVDVTARRLASARLPVLEPKAFSRQVEIDGVPDTARFRTVHLDPGYFQPSRLYFCEHQTPGLVWQPAFMAHPNSAHDLQRLVIAGDDFEEQERRFRAATGGQPQAAGGDTQVEFISREELGDLCRGDAQAHPENARVAMMTFGVESLVALRGGMEPKMASKLIEIDNFRVRLPASECFGVAVEFQETSRGLR
jgi:hypothetical protein